MGVVDELVLARKAYDSRDWAAAYARFSGAGSSERAAEGAVPLDPGDLSRCGLAAWLLGRGEDAARMLQRAHATHLAAGETAEAARAAFWIGLSFMMRGDQAVAMGWLARGERLAEELPDHAAERGLFLIPRVMITGMSGQFAESEALSRQAEQIGTASGDVDLVAFALHGRGRALVAQGDVEEGMRLLDEAMATVMAGGMTAVIAGIVYCSVIEACQDVRDFGRARQWTRVLSQWCDTQPDLVPFVGQCALHRGQLMHLAGAYAEAMEELDLALVRYEAAQAGQAAGLAHYERAEVLRRQGRWDAAAAAYEDASAAGCDPHPGLALVWLAQGRLEAAHSVAARLAGEGGTVGMRVRVLPAVVETAAAAQDGALARSALTELERVTLAVGTAATRAWLARSRAMVARLDEDPGTALVELRAAAELWHSLEAPVEAALVRLELAEVLEGVGDASTARVERAASEAVLRGAGAHVPGSDQPSPAQLPAGLTAREVDVLRLVAQGLTNPRIAQELVLSEKTVARHLSNIFGKLGVGSRTAAAAFAFEHDLA